MGLIKLFFWSAFCNYLSLEILINELVKFFVIEKGNLP